MKLSFSSALLVVALPLSAFALVGCSEDTTDSDVGSASANQTRRCDYETFGEELKVKYDAAADQFAASVEQARKDREATLSSLPQGEKSDQSQAILNKAVSDYNDKVAADGPIHKAFDASIKAAKDQYDADVKACR